METNLKYIFSIVVLLLSSSFFLYDITGRTECFWYILGGVAFGSFIGMGIYISLACVCIKIFENNYIIKKTLK
jgi:hypothetical protein